jgi:hypothetical protein
MQLVNLEGHVIAYLLVALCSKPGGVCSIPNGVTGFFNLYNSSSCTMALGSTQPLTSTRNLPGGKGWLVNEADNLTAICEPTDWKIWEP